MQKSRDATTRRAATATWSTPRWRAKCTGCERLARSRRCAPHIDGYGCWALTARRSRRAGCHIRLRNSFATCRRLLRCKRKKGRATSPFRSTRAEFADELTLGNGGSAVRCTATTCARIIAPAKPAMGGPNREVGWKSLLHSVSEATTRRRTRAQPTDHSGGHADDSRPRFETLVSRLFRDALAGPEESTQTCWATAGSFVRVALDPGRETQAPAWKARVWMQRRRT